MKILLIEDDEIIGDAVKSSLEKADYVVEWAKNGLEGEIALTDQHFEAIILDLGLPKKGGLDILKNLRSKKIKFPVLIISANEQFDNKILGLDLGADDFLAKPFNLQELHARLRAIIRRSNQSSENMIEFGPLHFDIKQRAFLIKGKELNLNAKSYFGEVCELIYGKLENTYAHLVLDYCGELPKIAKEVEYALNNNIVAVGGTIAVTFVKQIRGSKNTLMGEKIMALATRNNNDFRCESERSAEAYFHKVTGWNYEIKEFFYYQDKGHTPMALVIIKRIK